MLAVSATSAVAASAPSNEWKFDEATAGDAPDLLGGNNAIANGNPVPQPSNDVPYTSPANPDSVLFNGQNFFDLNNPVSADFTICAWIKTLSTGGEQHFTGANIIESEAGGFAYDWGFGINSGGKLMFGNGGSLNGNDVDANVMGSTVVADNNWHDVCVTRNNTTGEDILFVDGRQDASGFTGTALVTQNPLAHIGSGSDGATPFVGNMDDLRIYQQVLSPEEIASNSPTEETAYQNNVFLANTGAENGLLMLVGSLMLLLGAGSMTVARITRKL
jgi:hypothetical protein